MDQRGSNTYPTTLTGALQVLDRLELLEDDRLGTFDQLLQAQDEVTSLQARVDEVNKRMEVSG